MLKIPNHSLQINNFMDTIIHYLLKAVVCRVHCPDMTFLQSSQRFSHFNYMLFICVCNEPLANDKNSNFLGQKIEGVDITEREAKLNGYTYIQCIRNSVKNES